VLTSSSRSNRRCKPGRTFVPAEIREQNAAAAEAAYQQRLAEDIAAGRRTQDGELINQWVGEQGNRYINVVAANGDRVRLAESGNNAYEVIYRNGEMIAVNIYSKQQDGSYNPTPVYQWTTQSGGSPVGVPAALIADYRLNSDGTYTAKAGASLAEVATRNGLTVDELKGLNDLPAGTGDTVPVGTNLVVHDQVVSVDAAATTPDQAIFVTTYQSGRVQLFDDATASVVADSRTHDITQVGTAVIAAPKAGMTDVQGQYFDSATGIHAVWDPSTGNGIVSLGDDRVMKFSGVTFGTNPDTGRFEIQTGSDTIRFAADANGANQPVTVNGQGNEVPLFGNDPDFTAAQTTSAGASGTDATVTTVGTETFEDAQTGEEISRTVTTTRTFGGVTLDQSTLDQVGDSFDYTLTYRFGGNEALFSCTPDSEGVLQFGGLASYNGNTMANPGLINDLLGKLGLSPITMLQGLPKALNLTLEQILSDGRANSASNQTTGAVNNSQLDVVNNVNSAGDPVQNEHFEPATGEDNLVVTGGDGQQVFFNGASQDGFQNVAGSMTTDALRPGAEDLYGIDFGATLGFGSDFLTNLFGPSVIPSQTAAIGDFNNFSLSALSFLNIDPLVLDLDGDGVELFSADEGHVLFDIDGNDGGYKERTGWVGADDGILVVDLNTNGQIDGISETISEKFNGGNYANAYAALAPLDQNGDGKITSADSIFSTLRVWQDGNSDGITDAGELKTLASLNITQIGLGTQTTQVGAGAATSYQLLAGNEVRATATYTRSDNSTRATASVNLVASAMGHSATTTAPGTTVTSEAGTASYSTADTLGATINLATHQTTTHAAGGGTVTTSISSTVKNAYGQQGNDVLIGDAGANWLGGGLGSDTLQGGAGDDVLLIDAQDLQVNIDGGDGFDVAQAVGGAGVTLNLAQAHIEVAIGGEGNDVFIGGGRSNVFIEAGAGDDIAIGGAADDVLSGEEGDDLLDGGQGDDLIRGHRGNDQLIGGSGNDLIDGGLGDDEVSGGSGNDIIQASAGDDTIDGGSEFDIVEFSGSYSQYRVTRTDQGIWVADTVAGRDGTDFLVGVEAMSFSDISRLRLNEGVIAPVADALTVTVNTASPSPITISAASLLANDVNIAGDPGTANSSTGSPLHILSVSDAVGGTVALNAGNVVFTPKAGYNGGYSFKYTVENQEGQYTAAVQHVGSTTQSAPMKGSVTLRTAEQPTDPLFGLQWYLNDANVVPVWKDYSGKGVRIGQFEPSNEFQTGKPVFDYRHPDLQQNVDAAWLASGTAATTFSNHATLVAGIMVAARNNEGGIGVAYDAKLSGVSVNLDDNASHAVDWSVLSQWKNYDVVNNSWGMSANFGASYFLQPEIAPLQDALRDAATQGRHGLGTVLVFGAGNSRDLGQNANQMLSNSSFAIQVGAINTPADLGSLQPAQTPYSNPGASILVSAPGSNVSTTGIELTNADGSTFYADAQTASGTSFATPLVSGVVALMLEANPNLGYRDVKEILALTARSVAVDPGTPSDWTFNHATNWNGGGMHVSHDYGFGAVDAKAAVRLAETWQRTGTALNPNSGFDDNFISTSGEQIVNQAIPDGSGALTKTVTLQPGLLVEHAEVHLQLTHQRVGDLVVTLISPTGTQSVLVNRPGKAPGSGAGDLGDPSNGTLEYSFGSTHDLGELSGGTWTLKVEDKATGAVGTLDSWELGLSGKDYHGEDNYVYTNEYATLAGGARSVLSDAGGFDTLNAAAVDGNTVVNLQSGSATIAGAGLTIASGTTLEQVFTGDGNDTLTGDANRNRLSGGRGADIINGGAGQDIVGGDAGNDTLTGGADADLFVFNKDPNSTDTVTDFSVSAGERIALVGFGNLTFSGLTITQEGANARVSFGSGQSVVLQNVTASSLTSEQFRFFDVFNFARVYIGTDAGEGANLDPAITLPALYFARGGRRSDRLRQLRRGRDLRGLR
jgi:subtilisin-like proprotein convertase family protein